MSVRVLRAAAAVALLAAGCTTGSSGDLVPTTSTTATAVEATTASSPAPTSAPPTSEPTSPADPLFGTGTITVDGQAIAVSGDCDISRAFGEERVTSLDDEVDILLAVDNLTGDGGHRGPFPIRVTLLTDGPAVGSIITSTGGPAGDTEAEGEVEVAELRDRRQLEFLDVAVLHLESTQQGPDGSYSLVVDVTCPISRPG